MSSAGHPLDAGTLAFAQRRLGHDVPRADIVFRQGHYRAHTREGRALLAHELVHVVQQRQDPLRPRHVQRVGFFENIGILLGLTEGNFSDDELAGYLDTITRKKRIEDSYDSDNKARAIVRKWKAGHARFSLLAPELDRIAARRAGVENSLEWLATIEAITWLEQEIEALRLQLRPSP